MARHRKGSVKIEKGGIYARVTYVDNKGRSHQVRRRARTRNKAERLLVTLCEDLRIKGAVDPRGSVLIEKDTIWARVTYVGPDGNRRQKKRRAENKTHARQLIDELLRELKDHGAASLDADRMTFAQLAKEYEESELVPAIYADGHKVHGRRSLITPTGFLKSLRNWFGSRLVRTITHTDIQSYRLERLQQKTKIHTTRSIASVNRELETLRAVFNYAKRQGWLQKSPFESGKGLIIKSAERERTRILSKREEQDLLAQCVGRRAHLRSLIIAALDTAMRRGELFQLQWSDIDFNTGEIRIRATTTKTLKERVVNMTSRVQQEMQTLWENSTKQPHETVFGITTNVKRSFGSARKDASIRDVRFHDLRHTATTRMIESGMPMEQVMKVTGHAQMKTFLRYVNVDERQTKQIATALDRYNARLEAELGIAEASRNR